MYTPLSKPNTRIEVADILRAIAIAGIVMIHFVEHMNFYDFPVPEDPFWKSVGDAVWDTVFFLLSGKMYAIFSLLFGLSFFIQHDNQAQRGKDFRPRFVWRMTLLMGFGLLDLMFYNGDILTLYAVCGMLVIPLIRVDDKVLKAFILLLMLQPVELVYMIMGLFNPELKPLDLGSGPMWGLMSPAQAGGSFGDVARVGIEVGFPINYLWAIEHGRMTQTVFLFLLGIWLGRKRLFYNEGDNLQFWKRALCWSVVAFFILHTSFDYLLSLTNTPVIRGSLETALNMWRNFSMTTFYVSGVLLLFYQTRSATVLRKLAPYGRMSLTHYIGQSVIGGFLFYHWGLGLYTQCYHTSSLLLGVCVVILQCIFSTYWAKYFKRGPLEGIWYKLTWIGSSK